MSTSSRERTSIRTIGGERVIVADPIMVQLYDLVERLAPVRLPVLISGETGCGKELVAIGLHACSPRAEKPLIPLNCAALHEMLVESELFGHEKGAFSDAVTTKVGLIETADGSTLFLDEIGDLSLANQAKILRVLESNRVMRLGDTKERRVDVRIVAATHRDLRADVAAGRFRQDLYYRLCAARLYLPPLRERPNELPLLATMFLKAACRFGGRELIRITADAVSVMHTHAWPGNVRELKNMMQYFAATLPGGQDLLAEHVIGHLRPSESVPVDGSARGSAGSFRRLADEVRELEVARIRGAVEATGGKYTRAAGLLGVPVRTFYSKAKQYGITDEWRRRSGASEKPPGSSAPANLESDEVQRSSPSDDAVGCVDDDKEG